MNVPSQALSLGAQAAFVRFGTCGGLLTAAQVEAWADSCVQALDRPSPALLDVCLSAARKPSPAELAPLLLRLEGPSDAASGLGAVLDTMRGILNRGELSVHAAINALLAWQWMPPITESMQLSIAGLGESLELVELGVGEIDGRRANLEDLRKLIAADLERFSQQLERGGAVA